MFNYRLSITKEQINALPVISFPGAITVVDTEEKVAEAMGDLMRHKVIGFDTETRPSFRKGRVYKVALMQLSTPDRCYLFRLNLIGMPDALCKLIEDESITKVGLSVHDDFHVMHRSSDFEPRSFVDLQEMVHDYAISDISLQKVYAIIFGGKISKAQRLTNWEADKLTGAQQKYAALDAWACLKIYEHLAGGKFNPAQSMYKTPLEPQD